MPIGHVKNIRERGAVNGGGAKRLSGGDIFGPSLIAPEITELAVDCARPTGGSSARALLKQRIKVRGYCNYMMYLVSKAKGCIHAISGPRNIAAKRIKKFPDMPER